MDVIIAMLTFLAVGLVFSWVLDCLFNRPSRLGLAFNVLGIVPRGPAGGGSAMLEITMDGASKARIQLKPKTASGASAPVQAGSLQVVARDGSGTAVNPVVVIENADTFTVQADLPGDGSLAADLTFDVMADADLGPGEKTLQDSIVAHITAEQATDLGLTSIEVVPR